MSYYSKTFAARTRNYWAVVSQLLNQTLHFGGAPYPLTFSEMCHLNQHRLRYRVGRVIVDGLFSLFGEDDHCAKSFRNGTAAAIYRQRLSRQAPTSERVYMEGYL